MVDFFQGAWDEYKQNLIEMKLQRLGVERGGNSAPPGQSHVHARATSVRVWPSSCLPHFIT